MKDNDDNSPPRVTGRAWVENIADRAEIVRQVLEADWSGDGFECFDAEYGVRVVSAAGEVELHYCFWCENVEVHGPAGGEGIHPFAGGPGPLVVTLARKLGIVRRPWWRFWG